VTIIGAASFTLLAGETRAYAKKNVLHGKAKQEGAEEAKRSEKNGGKGGIARLGQGLIFDGEGIKRRPRS